MRNRIYELGKAIGEGNFSEYMQADWKETKDDFRNSAKWIADNKKDLLALASSPIIGNLSTCVRERTAEKYGDDRYSFCSGFISSVTNLALYSACSACTGVTNGGLIGFGYGLLEIAGRLISASKTTEDDVPKYYFPASPVGKVISLPIDVGIGVYDGIKSRSEKK